jgi:hypothetical protein
MKRIAFVLTFIVALACRPDYPAVIHVDGGRFHVQGIALDQKTELLYCSFTSAFFKTDLKGNIVGSITGINGHLGAMTFDPKGRKVYASLEIKDDAIGKGIADALGAARHERSGSNFFVAEIDVDKVNGFETPFDEAVILHPMDEVRRDYLDVVTIDGKEYEHRYGCSGMDGITIGPGFGKSGKKKHCLYVAYGIYGDVNRMALEVMFYYANGRPVSEQEKQGMREGMLRALQKEGLAGHIECTGSVGEESSDHTMRKQENVINQPVKSIDI